MNNKKRIEFDSIGPKKLTNLDYGVHKRRDLLKILKLEMKKFQRK